MDSERENDSGKREIRECVNSESRRNESEKSGGEKYGQRCESLKSHKSQRSSSQRNSLKSGDSSVMKKAKGPAERLLGFLRRLSGSRSPSVHPQAPCKRTIVANT